MVITRSDAVGGAQIHVLEVSRALARAGHDVRVFVGGRGPFVERLRAADVPVTSLRHLVRAIDPRRDVPAVAELHAVLRGFKPDLVSTHSSKAGLLGRIVARALSCPVITTVHGQLLTPGPLSWSQRGVAAIETVGSWLGGLQIAVSEYDRRVALEHRVARPDRIRVVHNGLPDVGAELRAEVEIQPPRIIMVARLEEPKDPFTVVAGLARMRHLPWTLELVGDGPQRGRLEREIAAVDLGDRIELAGVCSDVPERLARAQVFLLSSWREGFPISILEAMRAGLPVVASRVGGIAESVEEGRTGTLFEARSATSLAAALEGVLREPNRRREWGHAGRLRFLEKFELAGAVGRVWAAYRDALA